MLTSSHDTALVLAALGESFDKWGRVPAQTVAEHLGFDVREVTALLYDLKRDGLVEGQHDRDLPSVWWPADE